MLSTSSQLGLGCFCSEGSLPSLWSLLILRIVPISYFQAVLKRNQSNEIHLAKSPGVPQCILASGNSPCSLLCEIDILALSIYHRFELLCGAGSWCGAKHVRRAGWSSVETLESLRPGGDASLLERTFPLYHWCVIS